MNQYILRGAERSKRNWNGKAKKRNLGLIWNMTWRWSKAQQQLRQNDVKPSSHSSSTSTFSSLKFCSQLALNLYYHLSTKLREGMVFTPFRLFIWRGYDVTSCLVPYSFWGWSLEGGTEKALIDGHFQPGGQYQMVIFPEGHPTYWHLAVSTKAGSTHPTGIHSSLTLCLWWC